VKQKPEFVKKACDRHFGVGSDATIFVQKSKTADVCFVFYNPDGSRAEMCGNGIRCLAKYAYEHGIVKKPQISVETLAGVKGVELSVLDGEVTEVKVDMGRPQTKRGEAQVAGKPEETFISQKVMIHGFEYTISSVGMGNPHAIMFYPDIDGIDVRGMGTRVRNYAKLFPKGTNVHFVEKAGENEFKIRTYERGVEDETLACGTGICASAVAAVLNGNADPGKPLVFHALGGDLKVEIEGSRNDIRRAYLIGPAEEVFNGEMEF